MPKRAQAPPAHETPTQLSFAERIAEAMLELRNKRQQRGVMAWLELKYDVSRRTVWRYSKVLSYELERDPPLAEDLFRQMVRRKVAERERRQHDHHRYFSELEEQLLVGVLMGHERACHPLTSLQFSELLRGVLLAKYAHDPQRCRDVQTSDFRNWICEFQKRHEVKLARKKKDPLDIVRAIAKDSAALDAWFAGMEQFERQWIQTSLIPSTGLQPFQVLHYDESGLEAMGKYRFSLVVRSNRQCDRISPADASGFQVIVGCVTSAAGDVISTQPIRCQPNRQLPEGMVDDLLHAYEQLVGPTEDQLEMPDVEMEVDVDDFLSATIDAWHDNISFHAFMRHMAVVLDAYRAKLKCPLDTPLCLVVHNRYPGDRDLKAIKSIIDLCASKAIEVVFLPRHLSERTQPDDCGLFGHLKALYTTKLQEDLDRRMQQRQQPRARLDFNRVFLETVKTISSQLRSTDFIPKAFRQLGLLPKIGSPGFVAPLLPAWYMPPAEREPPLDGYPDAQVEGPDGREEQPNDDDDENILAQLRASSRPAPSGEEEAPEHEDAKNAVVMARLDYLQNKSRRRGLQARDAYYKACHEHQRLASLKRRLSGGTATALSDADLQWLNSTQANLTGPGVSKRARTTMVFDEDDNIPAALLGTGDDYQAAQRPEDKAREKMRRRIERYRNRRIFTVFCEEKHVDMDNVGDEQAMELTHEFDAYTSDKPNVERLKEQWKWCRHNRKAREKLEKLMKRRDFIEFCYHAHQQPPENVEETELFQSMQEFCTRAPPVAIVEPAPIIAEPAAAPAPEPAPPEPAPPQPIPRNSRYGRRIKTPREISA